MLIALILFGVAVIAVAAVALLRSSWVTGARETRNPDPKRVEREVYEKLYGERTIRPIARKPPLKDPRPRAKRRSRPRDSDR